jgi:hypothetical protein
MNAKREFRRIYRHLRWWLNRPSIGTVERAQDLGNYYDRGGPSMAAAYAIAFAPNSPDWAQGRSAFATLGPIED